MPGGQTWREAVEELAPPGQRHLVTHEGHVTQLTERDYGLLDQGSGFPTLVGDAAAVRSRLAQLDEQGVQEVIYTPSGPDVARELQAFHVAARPDES